MAWRYRLDQPFVLTSPWLAGVHYAGEWARIESQTIEIATAYAWDGCSPAYRLPGGIWIGTWDGPPRPDGRPVTWRASLVHDVLCQFRREIQGLSKEQTVRLFDSMLREDGAPAWMNELYPAAVSRFGPQQWLGDAGPPMPEFRL